MFDPEKLEKERKRNEEKTNFGFGQPCNAVIIVTTQYDGIGS